MDTKPLLDKIEKWNKRQDELLENQYNKLTKKVTITLTEEQKEKARGLSVLILGKENVSGLIGYLINKLHKENEN